MTLSCELQLKLLGRLEPDEGLVVQSYLETPLAGPEGLDDDIVAYVEKLRALSREHVVNLVVAENVAQRCGKLLEGGRDADDPGWVVIQAAVRYFLEEDDAQDDIGTLEGFDDDARVLEAVETVLSVLNSEDRQRA